MVELPRRHLDIKEFNTGQKVSGRPVIKTRLQNGLHAFKDGVFHNCDDTIINQINGTSTRASKLSRGEFYLGDNSDNPQKFLIEVRHSDNSGIGIKLRKNGNDIESINGKEITFGNGVGASFRIVSRPFYRGIQSTIVISDPLNAPDEYEFSLKPKLTNYIYAEENGGITAYGENGKNIYFDAPHIKDASGEYGACSLNLGPIKNGLQTIVKTADNSWLRSRTGEVDFDPVIRIDRNTGVFEDTFILRNLVSDDNNEGGFSILLLSNRSSIDRANTLLRADLSALSGTVISSEFGLDINGGAFPLGDIFWYTTIPAWGEGSKVDTPPSIGESTWNVYAHPTAWNTPGCLGSGSDHAIVAENAVAKTLTGINNNELFPMTPTSVQNALGSNLDVVIIPTVATGGTKFAQMVSSEAGAGNIPYLDINIVAAAAAGRRRRMLLRGN